MHLLYLIKTTLIDDYFKYIYEENFNLYWNKIEPKLSHITLTSNFKDLFWKMISYEPKNRPTIDEILEHPWFNEINDKKKNNFKEFQKLEEEIKDYFTDLLEGVKAQNVEYIKKEDIESMIAPYNKSGSINNNEEVFDSNVLPKLLTSPMNIKYCINIKGNLNPVKFMNKLCKKIKEEFGIEKCHINTDPEILKLNLTFLKDIEKDENEEEKEDNKKELNGEKDEDEGEEDDEDNNSLEIQIKLYKDSEKYILRFKERKGNKKDFFDKYKEISNLVVKILKN